MTDTSSLVEPVKLSELLRARTRPAHEAVEATLGSLLDDASLDSYARLLAGWRQVHRYLEPAIAQQMPDDLTAFIASRFRRKWLEDDLTSLGQGALAAKSFGEADFPLQTVADALGSLYVLEGSTLGGQILCKRFAERLSLTGERGLRYFHGHGAQTALRWRETKLLLDDSRWSAQHGAIIDAANRTFEALTRYFAAS